MQLTSSNEQEEASQENGKGLATEQWFRRIVGDADKAARSQTDAEIAEYITPSVDAAVAGVDNLNRIACADGVDRFLVIAAMDGLYKIARRITTRVAGTIARDVAWGWGWLRELNLLSLWARHTPITAYVQRHPLTSRSRWSALGVVAMAAAGIFALRGHIEIFALIVGLRALGGIAVPAAGMFAEPHETPSVRRLLGADFAVCVAGHVADALVLVAIAAGLASGERNSWAFAVMCVALGMLAATNLRTGALQWGLRIERMPAERLFRSALPALTLLGVVAIASHPVVGTVPPLALAALGPALYECLETYRVMQLRKPVHEMIRNDGAFPHPVKVLAWGAPETVGVFGSEDTGAITELDDPLTA
ncbi:MAG TPA: hypothetical protein VHD87_12635 [Acidimicrobiales bacterium]|nr:hypothetical protein [Acidimicrobiales bacterium]